MLSVSRLCKENCLTRAPMEFVDARARARKESFDVSRICNCAIVKYVLLGKRNDVRPVDRVLSMYEEVRMLRCCIF